jgi:hypothetical protein
VHRRLTFRIVLLAVAMSVSLVVYADTLYLRAGEQVQGELEKMTPDAVIFRATDGEKTWPKTALTRIQLQRARQFDDVERVDQIADPTLKACLEIQPAEKDFPAEGAVTLLRRRICDLTTDGVVKETNRAIIKVLQQRGEEVASIGIPYFEDTDSVEVDFALTVTADGRVLHLSDTALKKESVFSSLPDYRRLGRLRFACKEPRPGSVLDVQYTVTRKRDAAIEPFYCPQLFRDEFPILRKEVLVVLPSNAANGQWEKQLASEIDEPDAGAIQAATYTVRNAPDAIKPILKEAGKKDTGDVVVAFTLTKPQPGIIEEPLMPPRKEFAPSLTLGVAATWEQVAGQYAEKLAASPPLPEALQAKARELAQKGGAEAIHNFVAKTIRTAPVPQLSFHLIPRAPDATAQRGLANELDKNFLYFNLLKAAGVECVFALVRDRGQGPLSRDVPSLQAFDRSAVYLVKEKVFSNAASDQIPFGVLPAGLQDAPALLAATSGAVLTQTQQSRLDEEQVSTRFDASLDAEGGLELTVTFTATGNSGSWMRAFKDLDEQKLRNQLQQFAGSIHPAAVMREYKTSDFADLTVTPSITLTCAIPGFAIKAGGDLMLFNIPVIDYQAGDVGRPTREHDLFWRQVERRAVSGAIHLPEGFAVYALPGKVRFDSPIVAYTAKLKKHRGNIEFKDTFDLKAAQAPREAYPGYKHCMELRADLARQRIILVRKK